MNICKRSALSSEPGKHIAEEESDDNNGIFWDDQKIRNENRSNHMMITPNSECLFKQMRSIKNFLAMGNKTHRLPSNPE